MDTDELTTEFIRILSDNKENIVQESISLGLIDWLLMAMCCVQETSLEKIEFIVNQHIIPLVFVHNPPLLCCREIIASGQSSLKELCEGVFEKPITNQIELQRARLLIGLVFVNVLHRFYDPSDDSTLDFVCNCIHASKSWPGDTLHHILYLFITLQDRLSPQSDAVSAPSSTRPHTFLVLLSTLQDSIQCFELGQGESLRVILGWLATTSSKISSLQPFSGQIVMRVACIGQFAIFSGNEHVMKTFLGALDWPRIIKESPDFMQVFCGTSVDFLQSIGSETCNLSESRQELVDSIYEIAMTLHCNAITSPPIQTVDPSIYHLAPLLATIATVKELPHLSDADTKGEWAILLVREGRRLLNTDWDDCTTGGRESDHLAFLHFAHLFQLFPGSMTVLQKTPMLVETLAVLSNIPMKGNFLIKSVSTWIFCRIVQRESKIAVASLLPLDWTFEIETKGIRSHQDLVWLFVSLQRLYITLEARARDASLVRRNSDSTRALQKLWSTLVDALCWPPILQREFEPLSDMTFHLISSCIHHILLITRGTYLTMHFKSNKCLGAVLQSLSSRGFGVSALAANLSLDLDEAKVLDIDQSPPPPCPFSNFNLFALISCSASE